MWNVEDRGGNCPGGRSLSSVMPDNGSGARYGNRRHICEKEGVELSKL